MIRLLFIVIANLVSTTTWAEILYARPDANSAITDYFWEDEAVTTSIPLAEAIAIVRSANGSRPLEIRLLRLGGSSDTPFSLSLGSTARALKWKGSEANRLVIRGQVDRSGATPRALTTIVGEGSLRQILCAPHGVDLCGVVPADGLPDRRQDLLDYLSGELNPEPGAPRAAIPLRLNCIFLWDASFVDIRDIGFRECWLAAVAAYASSNIGLSDSVVDGSTYAFAAIGKSGAPETSHSFQIVGNLWRQSAAAYRSAPGDCDIRSDWSCPVSIWSDIPWAVVHHHFWSPLNGALFTAKDTLGNVRIANNHIIDAYNGIRVRLSSACLAATECRERTNAGYEVVGNTFEKIRDNAIEPEGQATDWIVKHNIFNNVYAPISTDGVAGHRFLVFGNRFILNETPGGRCVDEGWSGSRQFKLSLGGNGRWSNSPADGEEARCHTHSLGTVIKMGTLDDLPEGPSLDRIFFFNNSLMTRSPLFRGSPGPPISSFNNRVEFTGCGEDGALPCRQSLDSEKCSGVTVWTRDHLSVVARCFAIVDQNGRPIPHVMRFTSYNRSPGPEFDLIDLDRVISAEQEHSVSAGCKILYSGGSIQCLGASGFIGAVGPNGQRFDLSLPFGFPFIEVLRRSIRIER